MARRKKMTKAEADVFAVNPYMMSERDLKANLKRKVQQANKRLLRIEKSGHYSWAYTQAQRELKYSNRKRYRYGNMDFTQMVKELYRIEAFLSHPTSKVSEVKKMQERAWETLNRNLSKENKTNFEGININRNDFYRFLNSKEMQDFMGRKDISSGDVIEDMAEALQDRKITLDDLVKEYGEFMAQELPLDALTRLREGSIGSYEEYRQKLAKQKRL